MSEDVEDVSSTLWKNCMKGEKRKVHHRPILDTDPRTQRSELLVLCLSHAAPFAQILEVASAVLALLAFRLSNTSVGFSEGKLSDII